MLARLGCTIYIFSQIDNRSPDLHNFQVACGSGHTVVLTGVHYKIAVVHAYCLSCPIHLLIYSGTHNPMTQCIPTYLHILSTKCRIGLAKRLGRCIAGVVATTGAWGMVTIIGNTCRAGSNLLQDNASSSSFSFVFLLRRVHRGLRQWGLIRYMS